MFKTNNFQPRFLPNLLPNHQKYFDRAADRAAAFGKQLLKMLTPSIIVLFKDKEQEALADTLNESAMEEANRHVINFPVCTFC